MKVEISCTTMTQLMGLPSVVSGPMYIIAVWESGLVSKLRDALWSERWSGLGLFIFAVFAIPVFALMNNRF